MFMSGNFCNFPIDENDSVGTASDLDRPSLPGDTSQESFSHKRDHTVFPVCPQAHNSEGLDDVSPMTAEKHQYDVTFLVGPTLQAMYGSRAIMSKCTPILHCLLEKHELLLNTTTSGKPKKTISCFPKIFRRKKCSKSNSNRKQSLVISLPEHDPVFFNDFLTYIHYGKVTVTVNNVAGLLQLADIYRLKELLKALWDFAESCMTSRTVVTLLTASQRYSHCASVTQLANMCLSYIDHNSKVVLATKEFARASSRVATKILSRAQLNISENDRVRAIVLWAKRYHRDDVSELPVTLNRLLDSVDFERVTERVLRDVTYLGYVPPMPVIHNAVSCNRQSGRRIANNNNRQQRYSLTESESGFSSLSF